MISPCYVTLPGYISRHHSSTSPAARFIVNAANLIAPVIEKTEVLGYDWATWQLARTPGDAYDAYVQFWGYNGL